jgi:hypothetical protein
MSRSSLAALLAANPTRGADVYGVGGGQGDLINNGLILFTFNLSAHDGKTDYGHLAGSYTDTTSGDEFSYRIAVDCVNVFAPTTATIQGVVTKLTGTTFAPFSFLAVGDRITYTVDDGGNPSGPTPVDSLAGPVEFPGSCDVFFGGFFPNVTQGNIVVNDG